MRHFTLFPTDGLRCWSHWSVYSKIISLGNRTLDFTVAGQYNYRYAVKVYIKLDESIHGITVVVPTSDREIPGSIPGRYDLQIKITSLHGILNLQSVGKRFGSVTVRPKRLESPIWVFLGKQTGSRVWGRRSSV